MSQSHERGGSLWREGNFLTFWSGQAASQLGAQITELAIPVLAVVVLHVSAFEVGVLNAAGVAAFLVIGLPAGAWIDRMRKRHVMIVADAVRALALACLPILWAAGMLQLWHLAAVALVMGVATVFFDVAYQSIIPVLVEEDQIAQANGKLETTMQLAGLGGPAVGGWLISVLTAPFAIVATSGTYLVSLVALLGTRDREHLEPARAHAPIRREIAEGLRWVFGNPLLRRIVGTTAVSNLFGMMTGTMFPLLVLRQLGLGADVLGLVLSLGALGGLIGAIATPHLVRGLGEGRALVAGAVGFGTVGVCVPLAAELPGLALPLLVAGGFFGNAGVLIYNITQVSFRQRITPRHLLARMNASVRFCVWGVMPIGALLAGVLGERIGLTPTLWIGALGALLSVSFVVLGPFATMRDLGASAGRTGSDG